MTDRIELPEIADLAPELPPRRLQAWAKENLFSTPASGVLTIVFLGTGIFAIRGLLSFLFGADRRWDAVTTNLRLLMIQAYPAGDSELILDAAGNPISQIHRVWISVAIIFLLLAFTLAVYRIGGLWSRRQFGGVLLAFGSALLVMGILGPFSVTGRLGWLILGALFAGAGYILRQGEGAKRPAVPILGVVTTVIGLIVVALWTVPVHTAVVTANPDSQTGFDQTIEFEGIATSTQLPWTVIAVLAVVAFFVGLLVRDRVPIARLKRLVIGAWVASFPVIVLVILRDPDIDYSRIFTASILPGLIFAIAGSVLLIYLSGGAAGEAGRALGGLVLIAGVVSFFVSAPFVVRWLLMSLAMFALLAPTFGGSGETRNRYVGIWLAWVAILTYFLALISADGTVDVPGSFFMGGLFLTFIIAVTGIVASFPLGVLLALGRTSTMPIFRLMSTAYIEFVRGVPLITWLLVASVVFPVALPDGVQIENVMRAIGAVTLFSAAYLAENVRGGLQAIPNGQTEAARAVGMSTVQMTVFITMPQALRAVIPALVGQVIALFKDTSLVTIIGLFDFLHIARAVIPAQTQPVNFLGSIKETLIFAAIVYWIFTFTFSRISLRLEKKLGVGER